MHVFYGQSKMAGYTALKLLPWKTFKVMMQVLHRFKVSAEGVQIPAVLEKSVTGICQNPTSKRLCYSCKPLLQQ